MQRQQTRQLIIAGAVALVGVGGLLLVRSLQGAGNGGNGGGGTASIETVPNTLLMDGQLAPSILVKEVGQQFGLRWSVRNLGTGPGFAHLLIGEAGFASDPLNQAIGGTGPITIPTGGNPVILDASGPTSSAWPLDTGPFSAVVGVWAGNSPLGLPGSDSTQIGIHPFTLTVNSPPSQAGIQITQPPGSTTVPLGTNMLFQGVATSSSGQNISNSIQWWVQIDTNPFFLQFTGSQTNIVWNVTGFHVVEARVVDPDTQQLLVDSVGIVVQ